MCGALPFQLILLLTIFSIPSCLSSAGLFNFSRANAFIEIDTQPLSCSRETQKLFSLAFEVYISTNSSIIFTGISGGTLSNTSNYEGVANEFDSTGTVGDPLAFFIYFEKPYFVLTLMRLTDFQIRFHLHHTFGYFDRSWKGWHKIEVSFTRPGPSRIEINFKVDQKINQGFLLTGDIIWPDSAELKAKEAIESSEKQRFFFNEAFLGLPLSDTLARFAIESFVKYHENFRFDFNEVGGIDVIAGQSDSKFRPFRGAVKSLLLASECACGMRNKFGPKIIQIGPGVEIQSFCDASAAPPLSANLSAYCTGEVDGVSCGCVSVGARPICYCPTQNYCGSLRFRGRLAS